MVLLAELLLAAGVLFGVYRLATRPGDGMSVVEPDRAPAERTAGPLTADELVTLHIPVGFGYRKVDVDRLLDRLARQLPRATPVGVGPGALLASPESGSEPEPEPEPELELEPQLESERVSLLKEDDRG